MEDQESERGRKNWGRATALACAFEVKINAPVTHQIVFANVKSEAHKWKAPEN